MLRANTAKIDWSSDKKQWHVEIAMGSEVVKRWIKDQPHEADDDSLRSLAVATAKDEGYEVDVSHITIVR